MAESFGLGCREAIMQLTLAANAPPGESSVRADLQKTTFLLEGEEGSPNNFFANMMLALGEHRGPRHRHDFDQIRYAIEGEYVYAEGKVLPKGWVGYFPEGTFYGPQLRTPGLLLFYSQFGGASGRGHLSRRQRRMAKEELGRKGQFSKGMYNYTGDDGAPQTMEAHEAMGAAVRGARLKFPAPRYNDVIAMNPENFAWVSAPDSPGISYKWLGTFNERGTRVGFIRIEAGATLSAGMHTAPEMLFVTKGAVNFGDQECPRYSAIAFDPLEGPVPMTATEATEFLCIQLPTFASEKAAKDLVLSD
jgi:hypothetical protein